MLNIILFLEYLLKGGIVQDDYISRLYLSITNNSDIVRTFVGESDHKCSFNLAHFSNNNILFS